MFLGKSYDRKKMGHKKGGCHGYKFLHMFPPFHQWSCAVANDIYTIDSNVNTNACITETNKPKNKKITGTPIGTRLEKIPKTKWSPEIFPNKRTLRDAGRTK